MPKVSKVLVIGSGPIIIGQAAEFDYSGTQACRALREEGITTVLVNSNPATIMTDEGIADIVYVEPLTAEVLARIIDMERPDGLLPTLGGQTGLNLAIELANAGILDRYGVRSLGTPVETIRTAEERSLFRRLLLDISEPVPRGGTVTSVEDSMELAVSLGLPLIVRPSYTLGGTGGGIVRTTRELEQIAASGLSSSASHEVLIEQCLLGWKEIEFEVMRDGADYCIAICCMENVDPMGVHTGDSIVVTPGQTLTDSEYQMLRSASFRIIRALGIEGGCNIQFALTPSPTVAESWAPDQKAAAQSEYYVIEVNPRVSRSSALASKATGYPIARTAAKIATGRRLDEIRTDVTGRTPASCEPVLDYCVVKIPRWPFDKFALGDRSTGSQMKATGEVMAIDERFEAALQKAVRSLEWGTRTLLWEDPAWSKEEGIDSLPLHPNDLRIWAIMASLRRQAAPEDLSRITGIDPWFIHKLEKIVDMERKLLSQPLNPDLLWEAKRLGFSDEQVGTLADRLPGQVNQTRREWQIRPAYKMVDTCPAGFSADTGCFYSTYEGDNEAEPLEGKKAVVIGSGPIRIGQGIEFDYCCVHSAWALREAGIKSIIVNSNPETVSTDFDTSDRLYFEALDEEGLLDILANETASSGSAGAPPSIVQFGGQTPIGLTGLLARNNLPVLGSGAEAIDIAEDRGRFEDFLDRLGIPQPPAAAVSSVEEALNAGQVLGYPLLVRPSYVLGGRAMEIVNNETELIRYLTLALEMDDRHPVLIDKYLQGKEVELDAVCDGARVLIPGVMEHIERAGVHSGDSIAVYPGVNLTSAEVDTMVEYATRIGLALQARGLLNIQMVIVPEDGRSSVYVLEVNPRASRTVPFMSKVTGVPMVRIATRVMAGISLEEQGYAGGLWKRGKLVGIKAPVFSMSKLTGVDSYLGPEMKSTGEVMGIDYTFEAALVKALLAAGLMLPQGGSLLLSIADRDKAESLPLIKQLHSLECILCATEGTAAMIESVGLPVKLVTKKLREGHPNVVDVIQDGSVDGVINTVTGGRIPLQDGFAIRRAAAERGIPCFTSLDTVRVVIGALADRSPIFSVQPLGEYVKGRKHE